MSELPDLYPLKFHPIFKERIWGGRKLADAFGKNIPDGTIGESWELSDVENDESVVSEGALKGENLSNLIEVYGPAFVGENNFEKFGSKFPLLIKFIDAQTPLSVQLHPNNELAAKRHNSFGKTEMWYILGADDDSELILGFQADTDRDSYLKHLESKTLSKILYSETVNKGDTFLIEAGRVHAIGAGVLLAEIQQTSDITYRLYDWDRVDSDGNSRELHTELALDAIDFNMPADCKVSYRKEHNVSNSMVDHRYFKTNFISLSGEMAIKNIEDSFRVLIGLKGEIIISVNDNQWVLNAGETLLVPSSIKLFNLSSESAELLEVYV